MCMGIHLKTSKATSIPNPCFHAWRVWMALAGLLASLSTAFAVIICPPPHVTSYTPDVTHLLCDTGCEALSVQVSDRDPMLYQWYFTERPPLGLRVRLARETNATLTLCLLTRDDAGEYEVAITNTTRTCSHTNIAIMVRVNADTTPPEITCPSDRKVATCSTTATGVRATFTVTATDNYDTNVAVTCTPSSGSIFPFGTTTVTCTATDDCLNTSTCSFQVTAVRDVFAPAIHCPSDLAVVTCFAEGTKVTFPTPSTLDDTDTSVAVACIPDSGSLFPAGTTVVTCTATDNCGKTNSCRFQVTVRADTAAPVLNCPGDFIAGTCNPDGMQVFYPGVTATDDTDSAVNITCTPTNGSHMLVGNRGVRCTALDACGKRDDCSFTVSVVLETNELKPLVMGIIPSLLSTRGGTSLVVTGSFFGVSDQVLLNGLALVNPQWLSSHKIQGITPPLPSGSITVTVHRCGTQRARVTDAAYAALPPRLISVEPSRVYAQGGSRVIIHGENLRSETQFRVALAGVGTSSNVLRQVMVTPDGLTAIGVVPALPAGQPYGPRALLAEDTRGSDLLLPGITYVPNPVETEPVVLAMRQLEQDSLRPAALKWRRGFPSSMHVRIPVAGAVPEERARQFLRSYKTLLQQPNPDSDLVLLKIRPGFLDNVRFGQQYHGVPIHGAEMVITLQGSQVHMTAGLLLPPAQLDALHLNTVPALTSSQAELVCRTLLNRPGAPTLQPTRLVIFDLGLIDSTASNPHLAWQVILGGGWHTELFVDAHTGQVLSKLGREQSWDFQLTDAEDEATPSGDNCYNTSDDTDAGDEDGVYAEYQNVAEAVLGYQHALNAYSYFANNFAWFSYDNEDSQLEVFFFSAVDNASWSKDCELISIRRGWMDYEVMAHEFTHGVIQHSSDLIYMYQPGALNEHYADVMALTADWQAGDTNWDVCENRTGFNYAVRHFDSPTRRTFADYNYGNCGEWDGDDPPDYGCVHDNSEIPSHAAYWMTVGIETNGVKMHGIGIDKLRVLKWTALLNLPNNARFDTAAYFEIGIAQSWADGGINGFNQSDVCAVQNGWAQVGLVVPTALTCYGSWYTDMDGDHVFDYEDNCPYTPNPNQYDYDQDGIGDACDNCPHDENKNQADLDKDGIGDVCDPDIDGDGCLNEVDQHPSQDMVKIGSYFSVCCDNSDMLGFEGDDTDGDGLLNCVDLDDDNDGTNDVADPCPVGATQSWGGCSEYADCPCAPSSWRVTCAGGGCQMFFARFSWVMNPDPATDVVFDRVELRNQRLYLLPSLGNSAWQGAQAIAQGVSGGMKAAGAFVPGNLRRLEIWSRATANSPAQLMEVIGDFDPGRANWQQLALGRLLAVNLPTDSLSPWTMGATWRVGGDPAEAAADADQDGLPDGWELQYGLNPRDARDADRDADRDGASNRHEFEAGTHPNNPASCFKLTRVEWVTPGVQVQFNTELGQRYQLERSFDLASGRWTPVGPPGAAPPVVVGTGGPMVVSDADLQGPNCFYRLILLPE
jgi:Zn-dependent metalloprotease